MTFHRDGKTHLALMVTALVVALSTLPGWRSPVQSAPATDEAPTGEERDVARQVLQTRRTHLERSLGFCQERLQQLNQTGEKLMDLSERRQAMGLKPLRVEIQAYRVLGLATDIELRGSGNCREAVAREIMAIDAALRSEASLDKVALQTRDLRRKAREQMRVGLGATVKGLRAAILHDIERPPVGAAPGTKDFFEGIARQWQQYEAWKQAGYVDTFADGVFVAARAVYDDVDAWRGYRALLRDARALENLVARSRMRDASVADRASLPDTVRTLVEVQQRLAQAVSRHDRTHQEAGRGLASADLALED